MEVTADSENQKIMNILTYLFPRGVNDLTGIEGTTLNQDIPIPRGGEHYGLMVSDVQDGEPPEGKFVEYKVYLKGDPLAITYIRKYPSTSPTRNSVWAVFGYVNDGEARDGVLTLYNTYEQFRWVDGAHVSTLPLGFAPSFSQGSEEVPLTLEDLWIRAIWRRRDWRQAGGRRRKTHHRRRKTRHRRRKTRRSRR